MEFIKNMSDYLTPSVQSAAMNVIKAIAIFAIGWWVVNLLSKFVLIFLQKSFKDMGVASFLESLTKFALRVILIVAVLQCLGFDVTAILAAIAASLVAVGMSLKDSISNLVSGISLIINKPIHVGDYIECDGSKGTVIKIEMMYTFLQSEKESEMIVVPNSKLNSSSINRISKFNLKKVEFQKELSFVPKNSEFHKYFEKEFLLKKEILQMPVPEIKIQNIEEGNTSLILNVWCEENNIRKVKSQLETISDKFEKKYKK